MVEAIQLHAEIGAWSLAALADQGVFDRHYGEVAAAIAERIDAGLEIDREARDAAFADWIDRLQAAPAAADITTADFVAVCADLIVGLAGHPIVRYLLYGAEPGDRLAAAIVGYPNEVTALASGATAYLLRVRQATGIDPSIPLTPLIVENAADALRRTPEAALRFRELLQLTTT